MSLKLELCILLGKYENWKAELKTMMLDGRWSEAVVLMQNIIKNTPDNPDAYLNMVYLWR